MLNRLVSLRREQKGFTLIELMVVVAIIALLTTLAVPWLSAAIRKAKGGVGATELYTFSGAMERSSLDDEVGNYPEDLADMKTKGYVRPSTTFKNRFGNPYIMVTQGDDASTAGVDESATRTWYVLVDPGNAKPGSDITLKCTKADGTTPWPNATGYSITIGSTFPQNSPWTTNATGPDNEQVKCSITGDSTDKGFDAGTANVVRN
ncbi:MAG TPA: prepilin-type N-terminal cleavage/methylation domain-containing protein [Symbiobacteriaceae bacterium]|nr:prepilin-type N-terminal cleavage/methylation domain-containing protein [Symbiobacteriaceae bacterium]